MSNIITFVGCSISVMYSFQKKILQNSKLLDVFSSSKLLHTVNYNLVAPKNLGRIFLPGLQKLGGRNSVKLTFPRSLQNYSFVADISTFSKHQLLKSYCILAHSCQISSFYRRNFSKMAQDEVETLTNKVKNDDDIDKKQFLSVSNKNKLEDLNFDKLHIHHLLRPPTPLLPPEKIVFGETYADYMLEVDWDNFVGWHPPEIKPLQPISLHPAAAGLHYGVQVFEGMKAFRSKKTDKPLLFRPDANMRRLQSSCKRLSLPNFNEEVLLKLIALLVNMNESFIPKADGFSLYLRPNIFASNPILGLHVPEKAKLIVCCSPCGAYFSKVSADGSVRRNNVVLLAETKYSRSYPGSVGDMKAGGNYGPTIFPLDNVSGEGVSQILWLHKEDDDFLITEAGTMNIFIHWINSNGDEELRTPPLVDNLILPGITRDSVCKLAKSYGNIKVVEDKIYMKKDILKAHEDGRLLGCFGAGTAAAICPINCFRFEDKELKFPDYSATLPNKDSSKKISLIDKLANDLFDIYYGVKEHEWSYKC